MDNNEVDTFDEPNEVSEPKPTPSKFLLPVWDNTKSEEENMKVFNAWWNM